MVLEVGQIVKISYGYSVHKAKIVKLLMDNNRKFVTYRVQILPIPIFGLFFGLTDTDEAEEFARRLIKPVLKMEI